MDFVNFARGGAAGAGRVTPLLRRTLSALEFAA